MILKSAPICGLWLIIFLSHLINSCASERDLSLQKSPNFDLQGSVFKNQIPGDIQQGMDFWSFLKESLFGAEIRRPKSKLPTVAPDWQRFLAKDGDPLKWIWFGHSGLYLNLKGTLILIDTVFSPSASPVPFLVSRFQEPIATYAELPEPDLIVLSHDHYDHLDKDLIGTFAKSKARFLVPLAVGKHLREFGVPAERIVELDWFDEYQGQGVSLRATPAQHFSGRGLFDRNKTLWASWIIRSDDVSIFFSGDSGYGPHFKEIGERFGPFDLAFVECGQYSKHWLYVHMLPEEVIQATRDLKAQALFPVHWGVFSLALHDWFEPVEKLSLLAEKAALPLWYPKQGALHSLQAGPNLDAWWREHPDYIERKKALGLAQP